MQEQQGFMSWLEKNREVSIELLRIYLGIGLLVKGIFFALNLDLIYTMLEWDDLDFTRVLLAHTVVVVHVAGGAFLAIGLLTRVAALFQIPIILSAIAFIHLGEGLFSKGQSLEFTSLLIVILMVFTIYGGGELSVDAAIKKRSNELSG